MATAAAVAGKPRNRPASALCAVNVPAASARPSACVSSPGADPATVAMSPSSWSPTCVAAGKRNGSGADSPCRKGNVSDAAASPQPSGSSGPVGKPPQAPGRLKGAWYDAAAGSDAGPYGGAAAGSSLGTRAQVAGVAGASECTGSQNMQGSGGSGLRPSSAASSSASSLSLGELRGHTHECGSSAHSDAPSSSDPRTQEGSDTLASSSTCNPCNSRGVLPRPHLQLAGSRGATDRQLEQCMKLLYGGRNTRAASAPSIALHQHQQARHAEQPAAQGNGERQLAGGGSASYAFERLRRAVSAGASNAGRCAGTSRGLGSSSDARGTAAGGVVGALGKAATPSTAAAHSRHSSAPLVPRVALLGSPSSARRGRGRSSATQSSEAPVDPQLLLLRMKTAAVLSNSFMTCYVSDLPTSARADQARPGRAASARR